MDASTIITILVGVAGVSGGWVGGRKNSALASDTIMLLTTRMDAIQQEANRIPGLLGRIAVLESLVTQRADVETVKEIVTRIEEKLDSRA